MTWVLYFLCVQSQWGLYYGGSFATQKQCDVMAHRVEAVSLQLENRETPLQYICVQVPEGK